VDRVVLKDVYNPSAGVESLTWGPLDDVVMGGCSQSQLSVQQGKGETAEIAAVFRSITYTGYDS